METKNSAMKKYDKLAGEIELEMFGEERVCLMQRVEMLNKEKMEMIHAHIENLRANVTQFTHGEMVANLRKFAMTVPVAFWDEVENQIKEFGAVGIADLYFLSPANKTIGETQNKQANDLARVMIRKQLELTQLTGQCVYWINQNVLTDDVLGECIRELESWTPEGFNADSLQKCESES